MLRLCSVSYSSQLMLAYEYVPTNLRQHVMQNKLMLSAMDMIIMATQIAKVITNCIMFNAINFEMTKF